MEASQIFGLILVYTIIILLIIRKINGNKAKCIVEIDVNVWDVVEVGKNKYRMVYTYTYEDNSFKVEGLRIVGKDEVKKGDSVAIRINPNKPDMIYDKVYNNIKLLLVKAVLITSIVVAWGIGIIYMYGTLMP